ncbi:MAG: hypothetical protein HYV95_01010 [Opitutae bacterium]|nr:hypothetical protein [Opitutae bacterium]
MAPARLDLAVRHTLGDVRVELEIALLIEDVTRRQGRGGSRVGSWLGHELAGYQRNASAQASFKAPPLLRVPGPVVANIALCLIHQANYLLDQQLRRLEQDFLKEGGLREQMTKARLESRARRKA